jgi:hypothetical protein
VAIGYILPSFGKLCQEKSGNTGEHSPLYILSLSFSLLSSPIGEHERLRILPQMCSLSINLPKQSCQMAYFHTKSTNFGIFWKALEWKNFGFILWPFGIGA